MASPTGAPANPSRGDRFTDRLTGQTYEWNGADWNPASVRGRGGPSLGLGMPTGRRSSARGTKLKSQEAVLDAIINDAGGDYTQFADIEVGSNGVMLYSPNPLAGSWPTASALKFDIELRIASLKIKADKDRALREAAARGSAVVQIPTSGATFLVMSAILVGLVGISITLQTITSPQLKYLTYILLGSAIGLTSWIIISMFTAKSAAVAAAQVTS